MASKRRTDFKCADCGGRLLKLKYCLRCEVCRRAHCAGTAVPLRLSDLLGDDKRLWYRFREVAWPDQPLYVINAMLIPLTLLVNFAAQEAGTQLKSRFLLKLLEASKLTG